jgi:hypothetical protein
MYADDERKSEVQPEDDVQKQSESEVPKEEATEVDEASDSETPTDVQEAAEQEPEADTQDMSSDEQEPAPAAEADAPDVETEPELEVDVYGLLRLFVSMMAEQAWIHLGLQTAPGKTETEARLPEARVAIDTLQFLRQQLEQSLEDSEKRELDRMISTLQINYIQRA